MKSSAEVVAGTLRLVKDHSEVKSGLYLATRVSAYMGQELINWPSVEGWHTGREWIDSGTLGERINFVADQVGNLDLPGISLIADRMSVGTSPVEPEDFVDGCLDLVGPVKVDAGTRDVLIDQARRGGELTRATENERGAYAKRVAQMLQLIVASVEYQYA